MNIKINGQQRNIEKKEIPVSELLVIERVKNLDTVAVQVNGAFVKKERFLATLLKDGDEVEFVYFMGGGESEIV